ncbi:DUF1206 domain-containing protein [Pseudonocardia sp.]|uniref:DUF1206 domain-containing protein n=1 Tax=Pseudonocardia sp. TaxID=60912 RepID=UPI003D1128E4
MPGLIPHGVPVVAPPAAPAEAPVVAHDAADESATHPWMRAVGRLGLVSYGGVHLLIAVLVVRIALGGPARADKQGALGAVASTGPGLGLLWVIVAGLVALVIWQLAEAVFGHRGTPTRQRLLRTAVNLGEAGIFAALAWTAGKTAASGGVTGPGSPEAGVLFALPGGRWIVALLGLGGLVGAGVAAHRGVTAGFLHELDLRGAGLRRSTLVTRIGRAGWTALGATYSVVGVLLLVAAWRFDPEQPVGLDAGLKALGAQPFGQVLLVVLALGLGLFGAYCLFDARYRKA